MTDQYKITPLSPRIITEARENFVVWWFPSDFSQSRFGNKIRGGSNACTIIVVLIAQKWYQNSIKVDSCEQGILCQDIIDALGESIIQGNEIHKHLSGRGALMHVNLTVPEAIVAGGPALKFFSEWKSFTFLLDLRETLFSKLSESVHEWYRNPPPLRGSDLFVVLIAENRSVMFVFHNELRTVVFLDSHSHKNYGAVIACCALPHLVDLCSWYSDVLETCYNAQASCYELTFLYFKKLDSGEGAHNK